MARGRRSCRRDASRSRVAVVAPLWLLSRLPGGVVDRARRARAAVAARRASSTSRMLPGARATSTSSAAAEPTIGVGDDARAALHGSSRAGRAPLVVALHDALPAGAARRRRRDASSSRARAARRGRELAGTGARAWRAARRRSGDVALRVRTPLGLVARTLRYERDDQVLVAPSLAGVRRFRLLAVHQRLARGRRARRCAGAARGGPSPACATTSSATTRATSTGRRSARRGRPITREFTIEQSQTVYLLVDAGRSMTQLAGAYSRFEYALSSALVLADVAARRATAWARWCSTTSSARSCRRSGAAGALQALRDGARAACSRRSSSRTTRRRSARSRRASGSARSLVLLHRRDRRARVARAARRT